MQWQKKQWHDWDYSISMTPGKCGCNLDMEYMNTFQWYIFQQFFEIASQWMSCDLTDDNLTLVK